MKATPEKCHFLCSLNSEISLTTEKQKLKNSKFGKLLGIKLDSRLNFNFHIHDICQNSGQKPNAISRITPYIDFSKMDLLVNAFFYSQFNYCQLVWMCHNQTNNNKMNHLHERWLRLIYNDKKSSFEDLLEKDGSVSVHNKNFRKLAVELFKVFKGLSLVIFAEAFPVRQQSQHNMRNYSYFAMPRAKLVNHGLDSFSYINSKLWDSIPSLMKETDSIHEFKHVVKTWKPNLCSCRICKV